MSKKENKTTKVAWFELLSILKGCAVRMYNMAARVVEFSSRGYKIRTPHGWVKSTVIERRQQQLGRMTDFPPPVTFSVFYLKNHEVSQIKFQTMRHPLMNLVNTTLSQKYGYP